VKSNSSRSSSIAISSQEIGTELGSRVTLVQFSSAFCTPCRATRALLTDITADLSDVKHVDIDAEKNLDLVRRLDIRSTPTTLVLDKAGKEVGRAVGAPKRAEVLATLSAIT
jgi:thiol-disulfide isomerase/thioredoxin